MDPFSMSLLLMFGMNAIDMFSGLFQDNENKKAYQREKTRKETERDNKLALMDLEYEEAKRQAIQNADRSDTLSTNNERVISDETNNAIEALTLQQLADAYSFNYAAEQNAAQEGNMLSGMAASGTRTSSMNTAVDLQSAQNAQQLQLAEDQSRHAQDQNLFSILNAYGQNAFQIQNNRTDAYNLRHSYDEGGYNQKAFKLQRDLQENAYNNAIQDLQFAIEDNSGIKSALRNTGKLFGVKNANTANTLANYVEQFGALDFKTNTNYTFDKLTPIPLPESKPKKFKIPYEIPSYTPMPYNTIPMSQWALDAFKY